MQLIQDGKYYVPAMKPNRVLYSKCNRFSGLVTLIREKHLLASSCPCIRTSVHDYQMGSQLTDLREVTDFREVTDYHENPSRKSNVNVGHFT